MTQYNMTHFLYDLKCFEFERRIFLIFFLRFQSHRSIDCIEIEVVVRSVVDLQTIDGICSWWYGRGYNQKKSRWHFKEFKSLFRVKTSQDLMDVKIYCGLKNLWAPVRNNDRVKTIAIYLEIVLTRLKMKVTTFYNH